MHKSIEDWNPYAGPLANKVASNRGTYINAHVLLIVLNEFGKSDKMGGMPFSQLV